MRQFSIWQPLLYAFYSKPLYQDVYRYWRVLDVMAFLLILVAIYILPSVKNELSDRKATLEEIATEIIAQMPTVTIRDGQMTIDRAVPYIIYARDSKQPLLVFDTSDTYEPAAHDNIHVLVTGDAVFLVRSTQAEQRIFDLSALSDRVIDRVQVQQWLDNTERGLTYLMYPMMLLYSFVFYLVQALMHGFLGLIFARILQINITYKQAFCLAVVALTPMLVLTALCAALLITFSWQEMINLTTGLVYLAYAIYVNKER